MEEFEAKLLVPDSLSEVMDSLGISCIPSTWELKVTEFDFSLNLVWRRADCKEQNQTQTGKNGESFLTGSELKNTRNGRRLCSKKDENTSSSSCTDDEHMLPGESPEKLTTPDNEFSGYLLACQNDREEDENASELNGYYFENSRKDEKSLSLEEQDCQSERNQSEQRSEGLQLSATRNSRPHSNGCHGNNGLHEKKRFHDNKATCSCGEKFDFKERAIKHILFSCPVSLCFRIDLDLRIHDVINQWTDEQQRMLGRKWWNAYKTSGVPDIMGTYSVNEVDQLEEMINDFITKAGINELMDKSKNKFVLMKGLQGLPYELSVLIG